MMYIHQDSPDNQVFGLMIRMRRRDQGIPTREVADRIGVSQVFINMIERGERAPSFAVAQGLLRILGFNFTHDDENWNITVLTDEGSATFQFAPRGLTVHQMQELNRRLHAEIVILHWK